MSVKLFPSIQTGKEKYPALTGIRGFSAIAIFFDHFPIQANSHFVINVLAFFYVLSGFLIVRIYYDHAQINRNWVSGYLINRYARIYPVYFLLLTIAVFIRHDFHPWLLFKNYTLTHALFNSYSDYIIQPSWSLTVEECFYFLAPLIILIIKKFSFRSALAFAILLLLAALGISVFSKGFLGSPIFVFSTTFFGHFAEFYAGIFLALVIIRQEKNEIFRIKGVKYTWLGSIGIVISIIAMVYVYTSPPLNHSAIILLNNFIIPFPIGVLYYGLIKEKTFFSRILSCRISGILGRASYSFYLLHIIIINSVALPILQNHPVLSEYRPLVVVVTCLITYLISVGIFILFEEPLNLYIRKKYNDSNNRLAGVK